MGTKQQTQAAEKPWTANRGDTKDIGKIKYMLEKEGAGGIGDARRRKNRASM